MMSYLMGIHFSGLPTKRIEVDLELYLKIKNQPGAEIFNVNK